MLSIWIFFFFLLFQNSVKSCLFQLQLPQLGTSFTCDYKASQNGVTDTISDQRPVFTCEEIKNNKKTFDFFNQKGFWLLRDAETDVIVFKYKSWAIHPLYFNSSSPKLLRSGLINIRNCRDSTDSTFHLQEVKDLRGFTSFYTKITSNIFWGVTSKYFAWKKVRNGEPLLYFSRNTESIGTLRGALKCPIFGNECTLLFLNTTRQALAIKFSLEQVERS